MPYINQECREPLDQIVDKMSDVELKPGELNYILFAFCKRYVPTSYTHYRDYIGELNECVAEIRRSLLAPYEEKKKMENGEV